MAPAAISLPKPTPPARPRPNTSSLAASASPCSPPVATPSILSKTFSALPESFADLDGHVNAPAGYDNTNVPVGPEIPFRECPTTEICNVPDQQQQAAQQAATANQAAQQAQNQTTLNLNGTKVDVTFYAAEFSNGQKGAVIDANPQGACDN